MSGKNYDVVLTIAGSDGSGGAGIQADLKTFAALKCYGLSVITAITAQNTMGVQKSYPLPAKQVKHQIISLLEDIPVTTVKLGMLGNKSIVEVIVEVMTDYPVRNLILDPIICSSSGKTLLSAEGLKLLKEKLIPITTLITPNIPEAQLLLNYPNYTIDRLGEALLNTGTKAVLITGGHTEGKESTDYLYLKDQRPLAFPAERIITNNTHGTGCTFSSAIAAYLSKGYELKDAIQQAKIFQTTALKAGVSFHLGKGNGPLHHFHKFWEN